MTSKLKKIDWNHWIKEALPYLVIVTVAFLFFDIQYANKGTILDIDTLFHYNRFYDASEQIRNHNFSYFQMNYGFNQSGRVINALYGPIFAYLNGLLVILAGSWWHYQLLSNFILCVAAGTGMYLLGRKAKLNQVIATLIAVFFINIGGIQAWYDHANFTAWGVAFAPFVFIEALNMLQDHDRPIRWVRLMLVMSLLAQTHLMSTLILSVALVPFAIIGFIKTDHRKQMVLDLLKAVVGTLILTANVWGALIMLIKTNQLSPTLTHSLARTAVRIAHEGIIRRSINLTFMLAVIVQAICAICLRKKNKLILPISAVGIVFFFISTKYFPWQFMQDHFKILGTNLQFPHRLATTIAYPLILLAIGLTLQILTQLENKAWYHVALLAVTFLTLQAFGQSYTRISDRSSLNLRYVYQVKNPKYNKTKNLYHQKRYVTRVKELPDSYHTQGVDKIKGSQVYVKVATRGTYYRNTLNMGDIYAATHYKVLRFKLFDLIIKVNPDYLPVHHVKKAYLSTYYYIKRVIDPNLKHEFNHKVLKNGVLQISWTGKKAKKRSLPIVMYKQSQLTLNGKIVKNSKLGHISTPTVMQKKGRNVATLHFLTPTWFKALGILSLIAWLAFIVYGGYNLIRYRRQVEEG